MSSNYNPRHAKKSWRDTVERYAVELGVLTGLIVSGGILYLLTQIKIPV